jgi:hypothetical protein
MRNRLIGIAIVGILSSPAGSAAEAKLTIEGRVTDPQAKPIAGATVHVYTARPRVGLGSTCASCYPECGKQVVTDRRGRFTIQGLGDQLLYRLLFVAPDRVPEFRDRVDPLAGTVEQVLRVRDTVLAPGLRTVVGHVVDPQGKPVAGASVMPRGIHVGEGTMFGDFSRINARIQPIAITDAHGTFHFVGPDSITSWMMFVRARDLAPAVFQGVGTGRKQDLLRLETGAIVTGEIVREGRPVPGAVLGITQVDGNAATFVPPDTIATDERGRFTFVNVPSSQDYAFSGVVGSTGTWALRTVVRTVGENDSTTVLPPLHLEPGFRLEGRISLSDGKRLPEGTELTLGREFAPNPMVVPLDADGRFRVEGLPPETASLGIRVKDYRIKPSTPGLVNPTWPVVRIPMLRDRTGIEIELEPKPAPVTAAPARP